MSPIWQALEIVGSDALTLPHWQKGLGAANLALLRPFLTPRDRRATSKPCDRTFEGHGCRYRIVEHDDDTIVGICDEGHCERRAFTADEIVLYGFNDPKLAAALATAREEERQRVLGLLEEWREAMGSVGQLHSLEYMLSEVRGGNQPAKGDN